jgi:de-etiolated-1
MKFGMRYFLIVYGLVVCRFYCRDSGLLRFKIYTSYHRTQPSSSKRLVAFVFHPFEPFAISVQRANQSYIVNFHVRRAVT